MENKKEQRTNFNNIVYEASGKIGKNADNVKVINIKNNKSICIMENGVVKNKNHLEIINKLD
jgi:hypothetical protein